jgi:hypothetical protein
MLINLAGRDVVLLSQSDVEVALIVPQIEINLTTIVEHKTFSVPTATGISTLSIKEVMG